MVSDKMTDEKGPDGKPNYNLIHGRMMSSPAPGEEIVISGAAGAFPNSRNIEEFKYNLFNNVTMVTPNRRWGNIHPEIPECSGTLPEIDKFDAGYFGWVHIPIKDMRDRPIRVFMIQIAVTSNHQNGRDTHMRQIKVHSPIENPGIHFEHYLKFTTVEFLQHSTIR